MVVEHSRRPDRLGTEQRDQPGEGRREVVGRDLGGTEQRQLSTARPV